MRGMWFFVLLIVGAAALAGTGINQSSATGAGPQADPRPPLTGIATFYGDAYQGLAMAGGQAFDAQNPTIAAANHWPLGTRLRVRRAPGSPWEATLSHEERETYFSREIIVTVADRGGFAHELDLSRAAFALLGRPDEGVINVVIEPLTDAPAAARSAQSKR